MINYNLFFVFIFLTFSCKREPLANTYCKNSLYHQVVSDFRINSYFVKILVNKNDSLTYLCINNYELYSYLESLKKISENEYAKYIYKIIKSKTPLSIQKDTKLEFFEVKNFNTIDSIAKLGEKAFVGHFFENNRQKVYLSDAQKISVASVLFDWCIVSKINDESGNLVMRKISNTED